MNVGFRLILDFEKSTTMLMKNEVFDARREFSYNMTSFYVTWLGC